MKKYLLIIFAAGLMSCGSPQKKSIFEPLTFDELQSVVKKDSVIADGYKVMQYIRDSLLRTDIDKVKWADLSYGRMAKYLKFESDSEYFKPLIQKYADDWQKIYGPLALKVDSVSDYWKKYKTENSLDNYVKIELVEIKKNYYEYIGGIENIYLGFKLTPLKGNIEQIRFGYRIQAKIYESNEYDEYSKLLSRLNYSWCIKSDPFSKPTVGYWEADYKNEEILESENLQSFIRDYNLFIEVDEIRKDGQNFSSDDLNIPESVESYWEYEKDEFLKQYYIREIVKSILNIEYMTESEYIGQKTDSILKKKDQLCYEFFQLPIKMLEI